MTLVSGAIGSSIGFGLMCCTNAVMKLPMLRRPWEHIAMTGVIGYIGHLWPKWEADAKARVDEMREKRGLPPLELKPWAFDYIKADEEAMKKMKEAAASSS
eukprot:CAMPEP_0185690314 /NCGR_PEP_ID=MMETSP1164-20130828/1039_1 /TAXON_ID=1104430 /ORGANISM="Chrysoreinhardia sp, Strain CCMP2950" /LENGTH=100 /DNA_ID=CAMNT_0028356879 /DNA_START=35 /DNA_END=337 /DNA_ORIENTATION=+